MCTGRSLNFPDPQSHPTSPTQGLGEIRSTNLSCGNSTPFACRSHSVGKSTEEYVFETRCCGILGTLILCGSCCSFACVIGIQGRLGGSRSSSTFEVPLLYTNSQPPSPPSSCSRSSCSSLSSCSCLLLLLVPLLLLPPLLLLLLVRLLLLFLLRLLLLLLPPFCNARV